MGLLLRLIQEGGYTWETLFTRQKKRPMLGPKLGFGPKTPDKILRKKVLGLMRSKMQLFGLGKTPNTVYHPKKTFHTLKNGGGSIMWNYKYPGLIFCCSFSPILLFTQSLIFGQWLYLARLVYVLLCGSLGMFVTYCIFLIKSISVPSWNMTKCSRGKYLSKPL